MARKVGLVVGGHGEKLALARWGSSRYIYMAQGLCCVSDVSAIVKQCAPLVRLLFRAKCELVVVVLDREDRGQGSFALERAIRADLVREVANESVYVSCPDQMLENWMLADVRSWSGTHGTRAKLHQKRYEGKHGKNAIKRLFKRGADYRETVHGPRLLKAVRESVASKNSSSLSRFLARVR